MKRDFNYQDILDSCTRQEMKMPKCRLVAVKRRMMRLEHGVINPDWIKEFDELVLRAVEDICGKEQVHG